MTDPAEIDLEVIRQRSAPTLHAPGAYDINRLIAAVEALRERVAELETGHKQDLKDADTNAADVLRHYNRAEAAEGHTAELAEASDAVIDSGRRLRSDPGTHELALAYLCNVMGRLAVLDAINRPAKEGAGT